MLERDFILAVYDIIGIFLNIYNFFFILELAAQFVFKRVNTWSILAKSTTSLLKREIGFTWSKP